MRALTPHPFGLDGPRPLLLAHRGGGGEAPENSAEAIARLAPLGVDFLETDAHASRDGVVVVMHDPTLERTTDATGHVRDHTWEQLTGVRDASGRAPVRLDDLLTEYSDLKVNVDAKADDVVGPLAGALHRAAALGRVCVASFSTARLRRARRLLGRDGATSLGSAEVALLRVASVLPGAAGRLLARAVPGPRRRRGVVVAGAVCVQVPVRHRGVRIVDRAFVETAHARGLAVHVWTIDDPAQARRLLDLGVDGIVTDLPTLVAPEVERARRR